MKSDYAKLKQLYFGEGNELEKQDNKSNELFIKSNVENPILKELLNRIEEKYGCLLTNVGCITENGNWLSVKAVAILINELDKELSK